MSLLNELRARELVKDSTDPVALDAALAKGPVTYYVGYDPTAPSLHVGTLVPLSIMTRLQRAGHKPIVLVGGATGMVGDPSGKSDERQLQTPETLAENVRGIQAQLEKILPDAQFVDNAAWTEPLGVLDFLRNVGKYITVNTMLGKESVRARLEDRSQGISYTEFSYMLLQAYDFAHLAKTHNCTLQLGGSDQWGNITTGIELNRKLGGPEIHGLVTPLLVTSAGAKFGKSAAGTSVWLDPRVTSPYKFYQFWLNSEDADVARYLKMFTFLPMDEIESILAQHTQDPSGRIGQRRLAHEVTAWVHGAQASHAAQAAAQVLFGGAMESLTDTDLEPLADEMPSTTIPHDTITAGVGVLDLLVQVALSKSKGEARRLLQQGGVYVNNVRETDPDRRIATADLAGRKTLLLRAGKKSYHLVRVG